MKKLNRIAMRMRKMAKETLENLSPEMEKLMMEDDKVYKICNTVMMGDNAKLTDDVVKAAKYAVDNGFGYGQRLKNFIAYLQERKTTNDLVDSITRFVDNYKDSEAIDEIDTKTFVGLTAGGGFNGVAKGLAKENLEFNQDIAEDVLAIVVEFFNGTFDTSDYSAVGKLVNLVVAFELGASYDELKWYIDHQEMETPTGQKKKDFPEFKREIRRLVGKNTDIGRLSWIISHSKDLVNGQPTLIANYSGSLEELTKALENGTLDELLNGTTASIKTSNKIYKRIK